jgi:hypothetical protein
LSWSNGDLGLFADADFEDGGDDNRAGRKDPGSVGVYGCRRSSEAWLLDEGLNNRRVVTVEVAGAIPVALM